MTADRIFEGVVVLGSANLDVSLGVERLPRSGETLLASNHTQSLGGKGVNQAVACRRAGMRTALISAIGDDPPGAEILAGLMECDVDVRRVRKVHDPSGAAYILVDGAGENIIVVAAGANSSLTTLDAADEDAIRTARLLVLQCEVPLEVLRAASATAAAAGTKVVLNAAPAQALPPALLSATDVLVVNEHEARALVGHHDGSPEQLADELARIVPDAVVTLGSAGVVWSGRAGTGHQPALAARAIDTTAAGDTFVGYLAAGLAAENSWTQCIRVATAAASLTVQRRGAFDSIPRRADVTTVLGG